MYCMYWCVMLMLHQNYCSHLFFILDMKDRKQASENYINAVYLGKTVYNLCILVCC